MEAELPCEGASKKLLENQTDATGVGKRLLFQSKKVDTQSTSNFSAIVPSTSTERREDFKPLTPKIFYDNCLIFSGSKLQHPGIEIKVISKTNNKKLDILKRKVVIAICCRSIVPIDYNIVIQECNSISPFPPDRNH